MERLTVLGNHLGANSAVSSTFCTENSRRGLGKSSSAYRTQSGLVPSQGARLNVGFGFVSVPTGERWLVWNRSGQVFTYDGPKLFFSFNCVVQKLQQIVASPSEYIKVTTRDGQTEYLRGPVSLWEDPLTHFQLELSQAVHLNSNEGIVVYGQSKNGKISRQIIHGPGIHVPQDNEWLHHFSWHGDAGNGKKEKERLRFHKLLLTPQQMYFDVEGVRTRDDANVTVKLMLFYHLERSQIERMLDKTHDPIGVMVNSVSADVMEFTSRIAFTEFKEKVDDLNRLECYPQLVMEAKLMGYQVTKVAFRGYAASPTLQGMTDLAIEKRTQLTLDREREEQEQLLNDFKLKREVQRARQEQAKEKEQTAHQIQIEELLNKGDVERTQAKNSMEIQALKEKHRLMLEKQEKLEEIKRGTAKQEVYNKLHLTSSLKAMGVDVNAYLQSEALKPTQTLRIDSAPFPSVQPMINLGKDTTK
eukprot:Lithocolla_globosa_v1_NODE_4235_length_1482_cov_9.309741.p1 type:complete len:473 gc:universal NODE_4235_length_1482_cov_9.309741:41-1459(+)